MIVILWKSPVRKEWECETFEDDVAAQKTLGEYAKKYPWNTYILLEEKERVEKTKDWDESFGVTAGETMRVRVGRPSKNRGGAKATPKRN